MKILAALISWALLGALSAATLPALASGFGLGTQSGSGTGNAFAGGAAAADDASVAWSNPAGMSLLPMGRQVSGALHAIRPSFKFQNDGSTGAFAAPGTGDGGDGGDWAYVPNAFYTMDINPNLRFGLALNVPFGLKTSYERGWRGQMTALKSEIKTINVNPSVAYKISDTLSIGAGISAQKLDAELSAFSGSAAAGNLTLKADDIGYGFNVGMMFQAAPHTRIGATYRSSIKYDLEGTADFSGPASALLAGDIRADVTVPESVSISFFTVINPMWEVMGDVTWTRWSRIQQLVAKRTSATGQGAPVGSTLTTLDFLWDDAWRLGIGANYRLNNQTKLRFGLALDRTPTKTATRTPRLPDEDRTWVALGVQYRVSNAGMLDVGYAHEFVRDASINATQAPLTCAPHCLRGKFENKADIISVQYTHAF